MHSKKKKLNLLKKKALSLNNNESITNWEKTEFLLEHAVYLIFEVRRLNAELCQSKVDIWYIEELPNPKDIRDLPIDIANELTWVYSLRIKQYKSKKRNYNNVRSDIIKIQNVVKNYRTDPNNLEFRRDLNNLWRSIWRSSRAKSFDKTWEDECDKEIQKMLQDRYK